MGLSGKDRGGQMWSVGKSAHGGDVNDWIEYNWVLDKGTYGVL